MMPEKHQIILMTQILGVLRITGKNCDFLKLGYFLCFQGSRNLSRFSAMPGVFKTRSGEMAKYRMAK